MIRPAGRRLSSSGATHRHLAGSGRPLPTGRNGPALRSTRRNPARCDRSPGATRNSKSPGGRCLPGLRRRVVLPAASASCGGPTETLSGTFSWIIVAHSGVCGSAAARETLDCFRMVCWRWHPFRWHTFIGTTVAIALISIHSIHTVGNRSAADSADRHRMIRLWVHHQKSSSHPQRLFRYDDQTDCDIFEIKKRGARWPQNRPC